MHVHFFAVTTFVYIHDLVAAWHPNMHGLHGLAFVIGNDES